jgi:hypothetical protein
VADHEIHPRTAEMAFPIEDDDRVTVELVQRLPLSNPARQYILLVW